MSYWKTTPPLQWLRTRVLGWTPSDINTGWEDILVPQGAAEIGIAAADEEMVDWTARWLDHHLEVGFKEIPKEGPNKGEGIVLSNYCGNWGFALAAAAIIPARPEDRYKEAILKIADYVLSDGLRGDDHVILHGEWAQTVWVDTLYYTAPLFSAAYKATEEPRYLDVAIEQCLLHAKHLRDEETGLYHHDADPKTGVRTLGYWGRGNGWIIAALVDTLTVCPKDHGQYTELYRLYRSLAESLMLHQHSNGMWRVAIENPDSHLETSGTSMVLFALHRGIQLGLLEGWKPRTLDRGFEELQSWIISPDDWGAPVGSLMGSQSPTGRGGWDNLKLTQFGENTYTTGFALRLAAVYEDLRAQRRAKA